MYLISSKSVYFMLNKLDKGKKCATHSNVELIGRASFIG